MRTRQAEETVAFIRCNGAEIRVDTTRERLTGEWGGEQCEGCGADILETGAVPERAGHYPSETVRLMTLCYGGIVRCANCGHSYEIRLEPANGRP